MTLTRSQVRPLCSVLQEQCVDSLELPHYKLLCLFPFTDAWSLYEQYRSVVSARTERTVEGQDQVANRITDLNFKTHLFCFFAGLMSNGISSAPTFEMINKALCYFW